MTAGAASGGGFGGHFGFEALDGADAAAEPAGDFLHALVAGRECLADGMLGLRVHLRAAERLALRTSASKAGPGALDDHRALVFAEHAHQLKHRSASWRGGVQRLLVQIEVDAARVQLGEERHEVRHRAADTVHAPGRHHIQLTAGDRSHQLVEAGPAIAPFGTGDAGILEHGSDRPAGSLGDSLELATLVGSGLLARRNTQVKGNAAHDGHLGGHADIIVQRHTEYDCLLYRRNGIRKPLQTQALHETKLRPFSVQHVCALGRPAGAAHPRLMNFTRPARRDAISRHRLLHRRPAIVITIPVIASGLAGWASMEECMTDDPDKLAGTWAQIAALMPGFGLRASSASLLATADDSANPPLTRAVARAFDRLSGAATPPPGVVAIERALAGAGGAKLAAPPSSGPLALDTAQNISEPRDTTSVVEPPFDLVEALATIAAHRRRVADHSGPSFDPVIGLRGALDLLEHGTRRENVAAFLRDFLRGHAERLELERLAGAAPVGSIQ